MKHIQADAYKESFTCPHCGVLSKQEWHGRSFQFGRYSNHTGNQLRTAKCQHCLQSSVWVLEKMCYPKTGSAPFPNPEMPEAVRKIYAEAASISTTSPKASAAMLRLAVQALCKELGESGKYMDFDIKELVNKGLPMIVQQSLEHVKVIGDYAVHPGQINDDSEDVSDRLFELLNVMVEYMITLPNKVNGLYGDLPRQQVNV